MCDDKRPDGTGRDDKRDDAEQTDSIPTQDGEDGQEGNRYWRPSWKRFVWHEGDIEIIEPGHSEEPTNT